MTRSPKTVLSFYVARDLSTRQELPENLSKILSFPTDTQAERSGGVCWPQAGLRLNDDDWKG
jgi:hypothetical protein